MARRKLGRQLGVAIHQLNTASAKLVRRSFPTAIALNPRGDTWIVQAKEGVLASADLQTRAWEKAAKALVKAEKDAKIRKMAGMPDSSHAPVTLFVRERPRSDSHEWESHDDLNSLLARMNNMPKGEPVVVAEYKLVARTMLTDAKGVALAVKAPILSNVPPSLSHAPKRTAKKTTKPGSR